MKNIKEQLLCKLNVKGSNKTIDAWFILYDDGSSEFFTDELRYSNHLPIVFSKEKECFTVSNLENLRKDWAKKHNTVSLEEKHMVEFMEMKL